MRLHRLIRGCIALALIYAVAGTARLAQGYPVGASPELDKMAQQADAVVKVKAISSVLIEDAWFPDATQSGFGVYETRFQVISVVKGRVTEAEFRFHHYDYLPKNLNVMMWMPQIYHFDAGKVYLVAANREEGAAPVFRQMWQAHTAMEDMGAWHCADDKALLADLGVKDALWHELMGLTKSKDEAEAIYAIDHIDHMSGKKADWGHSQDFPMGDALKALAPLINDPRPAVATRAVALLGRESPFVAGASSPYWLATVATNHFVARGIGTTPDAKNEIAVTYLAELLGAASGKDPAVRAAAIRSLGLVKDAKIVAQLPAWSTDDAAPVREAAAVLWAGVDTKESTAALEKLAGDPDVTVRRAAAYAVGYSQRTALAPLAEKLLDDKEPVVWRAAADALMSMDSPEVRAMLARHEADERFYPYFTLALAELQPAKYRDALAKLLVDKPKIAWSRDGQMPMYTAWVMLEEDMARLLNARVPAGPLAPYLDALESPPNIGSGPYQTLYRLYWERGMKDRAASFRDKTLKEPLGYDMDLYFRQIDGRPEPKK